MQIIINKKITSKEIEQFSYKYKLQDLNLNHFFTTNKTDSLTANGWNIEINNDSILQCSKSFMAADVLTPVAKKTFFSPILSNNSLFNNTYLVNRLKKNVQFKETDSTLTFVLPGFEKAKEVLLAASFTNWKEGALPMVKVGKQWEITVPLKEGKHAYKYLVDNNWIVDPNNYEAESDNEGNTNSVICKSNVQFLLNGFKNAKKVIVAGSFNNWNETDLKLEKTNNGWVLPIYLKEGTYTYKFIVDNEWIEDPQNKQKFKNEFSNQYNSVIYVGSKKTFSLKGFENAKEVTLLGSFNEFRDYEINMQWKDGVWTVDYALGSGNYIYCFKIDNKKLVNKEGIFIAEPYNGSILLINPNHTFTLNGFATAKNVFVAGSFNNWNPAASPMKFSNGKWEAQVFLPNGKITYKFIVDDKWILDPTNKLWENNEYNTGNSIIWKK